METNWKVDSMHSEVAFKVRHMMISNVSGSFGTFDANVSTQGEDFASAKFDFSAAIESINTGIAVDPYGQTKAGMTLTGSIKRSEFGLTWSAVTEAGNVVVSDEIKLAAELQFIKQ
ncbi:MAG: YceI family protein [Cryomorphaceae bacterium]|jgi:polyisoprenoid-binding protein YceI|nr:YceI family protein [Cryomorphaceae bacterium]